LPGLDEQPDLHRAAGMAARRELRAPTRFMAGMCGVVSPHVSLELVSDDLHVDDELYFRLLASLNSGHWSIRPKCPTSSNSISAGDNSCGVQ